jgi:hypothetical protein
LYEEFLKEPNSEIAHHLLHTHYVARNWKITLGFSKGIFMRCDVAKKPIKLK